MQNSTEATVFASTLGPSLAELENIQMIESEVLKNLIQAGVYHFKFISCLLSNFRSGFGTYTYPIDFGGQIIVPFVSIAISKFKLCSSEIRKVYLEHRLAASQNNKLFSCFVRPKFVRMPC